MAGGVLQAPGRRSSDIGAKEITGRGAGRPAAPAEKGGPRMPEKLEPNTMDTMTIVLSDLPEELESDLAQYYAVTFAAGEYLFVKADDLFSEGAVAAAGRLVTIVDQKLQRGELARTVPMRVNIALYECLRDTAEGRIGLLRGTVTRLGEQLGVLNAFVCLLKQQISGEENARDMDRCMEACREREATPESARENPIPLLFVNRGIGVTIDLPLKATVRYLHILSHSSTLKSKMSARTELMTTIAMMEYDDEDSSTLQRQIGVLQSELSAGSSAKAQLQEVLQAQVEEATRCFPGKGGFSCAQVPVRSDAVGNLFTVLFGRKRLGAALKDVSATLANTYEKNVHERCCLGCLNEGQTGAKLGRALETLPTAYLSRGIDNDLDELERNTQKTYEAYSPRLLICLGEKKLRAQMEEQYQKMLQRSRAYIRHVVIQEMRNAVAAYRESGSIGKREKEINDRILRLKAKARAVGSAQSALDFLKTQIGFLATQGGVKFSNCTSSDSILLISREMNENWYQYAPHLQGSLNFEVVNYGSLEEQEFQALQITRFDLERYRQNRGLMFQVG